MNHLKNSIDLIVKYTSLNKEESAKMLVEEEGMKHTQLYGLLKTDLNKSYFYSTAGYIINKYRG